MEKIDKTYREAIKESLDKFKTEKIEIDDFVQEENEILPLCFGYFCKSISAILNVVITQMCKEDYPNVDIGSHKYNGKQKKDVSAKDVLDVLVANDFIRNMQITQLLQGFFVWLLDEPASYENIGEMWYDTNVVGKKWNEYVNRREENDTL